MLLKILFLKIDFVSVKPPLFPDMQRISATYTPWAKQLYYIMTVKTSHKLMEGMSLQIRNKECRPAGSPAGSV